MARVKRSRVFAHAAANGYRSYRAMVSLKFWVLGWYLRLLSQVVFFVLIGRLLGSSDTARFVLVGNVVMITAMQSLSAVASTVWERWAGTLPLLVAAPAGLVTVFMGRSVVWIADGLVSSVAALLGAAPLFGLSVPARAIPTVLALLVLVGCSAYALATFLGSLVLRAMDARNVVLNVTYLTIMAVCGVNVPLSSIPGPLRAVASVLPVTHGLQAVRGALAGAPGVWRGAALEAAVGAGWLVLAVVGFAGLVEGGRRDGSIEFGS